MRDEYSVLQGFKPREVPGPPRSATANSVLQRAADSKSHTAKLIDSMPVQWCVLGASYTSHVLQHPVQGAGECQCMAAALGVFGCVLPVLLTA